MWRNTRETYGLTAILFHWSIAGLFLCELLLGYSTQVSDDRPALQFELYQWHKSIGFLILVLAVPRLAWALLSVRPHALAGSTRLEEIAARAVHLALLALTILVPLAGWAIASASPLRIPSYAFNWVVIPNLPLTPSDALETFWSRIHALLAYTAGILALVHAAAAIHHHFRLRDGTLVRMLRSSPGKGSHPLT